MCGDSFMSNIYFFDIDNTLLDHSTLTIPHSALAAIDELKRDGHTVVVATGRAHGHAKPFIDQVRPTYAITQNGARILHGEEEVFSVPLPRARLVALFDWMAARGWSPFPFQREVWDAMARGESGLLHPFHAARALGAAIPDDAIIVCDGGESSIWVRDHIRPHGEGSFLITGYLGTLGVGQGFAIGAARAFPGRPVVLLAGEVAVARDVIRLDGAVRLAPK